MALTDWLQLCYIADKLTGRASARPAWSGPISGPSLHKILCGKMGGAVGNRGPPRGAVRYLGRGIFELPTDGRGPPAGLRVHCEYVCLFARPMTRWQMGQITRGQGQSARRVYRCFFVLTSHPGQTARNRGQSAQGCCYSMRRSAFLESSTPARKTHECIDVCPDLPHGADRPQPRAVC